MRRPISSSSLSRGGGGAMLAGAMLAGAMLAGAMLAGHAPGGTLLPSSTATSWAQTERRQRRAASLAARA
jgi:hypothetical protein